MELGALMTALLEAELGRTFVPFRFGGYADNILFHGNEEQKQRYLLPTISGERVSCFAITEPGAGSDAKASAPPPRDGDEWVVNGEKTFITQGNEADFVMVFAVTDKEKGADGGVTCFLVDRDMGWTVRARSRPWASGARRRWCFDNVRVPAQNVLGEVGKGFDLAMQWIGQRPLPAARPGARFLRTPRGDGHRTGQDQRVTFGQPIAELPGDPVDDRRLRHGDRGAALAGAARRVAGRPGRRLPAGTVDREALRRYQGQRDRRPGAPDSRRHGLHPGAADRALVPRTARCCASTRAPTRSSAAPSPATCCPGTCRCGDT